MYNLFKSLCIALLLPGADITYISKTKQFKNKYIYKEFKSYK